MDIIELACFWLCSLLDTATSGLYTFVKLCGGLENVLFVKDSHIQKMEGISERLKGRISATRDIDELKKAYVQMESRGISFVGQNNPCFPEKLLQAEPLPFGIFYVGSLPETHKASIAIVGARSASPYGQEMAFHFAQKLSQNGVEIISGMAMGVDGYAHRGALNGGGKTYGILGCGVNICYPKENMSLFEAMKTQGGIISEFSVGTKPLPWHFPYRNRIISSLSDGILVIEAREKSGSLITASLALDQGKDVFALPGRATDELSMGCNRLISDGAKLVTKPEDILEEYKISIKVADKSKFMLDNLEKLVYSNLCLNARSIDEICAMAGLGYTETARVLYSLMDKGAARQIGINHFIRKL